MKILIAVDSFKNSLSAVDVSSSIRKGMAHVKGGFTIKEMPLSDGGEGTMEILISNLAGEIVTTEVRNPLGENIRASYGIINGHIAIIEMAVAAGLQLISKEERNPLKTTTYGVGQLIIHALDRGCREFIIAIGGSATNEGGIGMAGALGVQFLDQYNNPITLDGEGLKDLANIELGKMDQRIKESTFQIACDVDNVLCGKEGASYVYAKQKGATKEMVEQLDKNLLNYSEIIKKDLGKEGLNIKGAGAAGGLGLGLMVFLEGELESGFSIISNKLNLEHEILACDLVITGEGKIDLQSLNGKVPIGVARLAKKHNKRVIVLTGTFGDLSHEFYENGVTAIFSIIHAPITLEEALSKTVARKSIETVSEQIARLLVGKGHI